MARTPRQPTTPAPDVPATLEANTVGSAVTKGRRTFLRRSGAWVGSGVALAALDVHAQDAARASSSTASPPAIPDSMKAPGAPVGDKLYGVPSKYEAGVIRNVPKNQAQYISAASRTPLGDLTASSPRAACSTSVITAACPSSIRLQHRLMLHGLVKNPLLFTVDELRRLPSISRIHFLECSGNPVYTKPYGKTASDLVGLVSCGEWTGVQPEAAAR